MLRVTKLSYLILLLKKALRILFLVLKHFNRLESKQNLQDRQRTVARCAHERGVSGQTVAAGVCIVVVTFVFGGDGGGDGGGDDAVDVRICGNLAAD